MLLGRLTSSMGMTLGCCGLRAAVEINDKKVYFVYFRGYNIIN